MFGWMAFCPMTAPWYLACYTAASVRHAACGVPYVQHCYMMRMWYGA
jgi:hypothetical protein